MTDTKAARLSRTQRRERILEAGLETFAELGYERASMAAIAKRAGVVPSVIYDHFRSKRDLYKQLLERHGDELIDTAIRELPDTSDPEQLIRTSMERFFAFVEDNRFVWRFFFGDPPADPELAAFHQECRDRATDATAANIESAAAAQGVAFPGVAGDRATRLLAEGSRAMTDGIAAWWYDHPEVPREEVVAVSAALMWQGLGGLAAAARSGKGP